jgi:hypothetical protein
MTTLTEARARDLEAVDRNPALSAFEHQAIQRAVAVLRGEELLTTGEARDRLGLGSINTVKRLVDEGYLAGIPGEHGKTWIPLSSIVALEADREAATRLSRSRSKGIKVSPVPSHRLSLGG